MDLADRDQGDGLAVDVLDQHETISLLVNNAGVALGGRFEELSAEDVDWLLQINLHAPIALVRAFLPALTARPGGHIVNVSSLFGLIAPPGQTAYA
ncbi:MAG: SDR family NAD(P)-dependent oxidoreductase, partial [Ornithinimicrobium sp.]|uniref:SDR family NAD(P)-dependent oxidoreductase n=1 Tax=Ornithinimicrobium sp. TaxID=1977084 RepID=UPI003D9B7C13